MSLLKLISIFILCAACSQAPLSKSLDDDHLVSVDVALDQARASYLRGCVEAFKTIMLAPSFSHCVEESKKHHLELMQIMGTDADI